MESFPIEIINNPKVLFSHLAEIPEPPKRLYMRGSLERSMKTKFVTIVGSRNFSSYGKNSCQTLIEGLAGHPITIISGLAIGIDSIAHKAALEVGLNTIAFPGSGLNWNALYPAQHRGLAEEILNSGGALLSEYEPTTRGAFWTFPRRNRLEAGISDITIVIEAEEKSGTLITARLATEYNKTVGAVPGPINSISSKGSNWLLRLGATPITNSKDILEELGFSELSNPQKMQSLMLNSDEEKVLSFLDSPKNREQIMEELNLDAMSANIIFSSLEIKGVIRENLGVIERII